MRRSSSGFIIDDCHSSSAGAQHQCILTKGSNRVCHQAQCQHSTCHQPMASTCSNNNSWIVASRGRRSSSCRTFCRHARQPSLLHWCCLLVCFKLLQCPSGAARELPAQSSAADMTATLPAATNERLPAAAGPAPDTQHTARASAHGVAGVLAFQHRLVQVQQNQQRVLQQDQGQQGLLAVPADAGAAYPSLVPQQAQSADADSASGSHDDADSASGSHDDAEKAAWQQLIREDISQWQLLQSAPRHLTMRSQEQLLALQDAADPADIQLGPAQHLVLAEGGNEDSAATTAAVLEGAASEAPPPPAPAPLNPDSQHSTESAGAPSIAGQQGAPGSAFAAAQAAILAARCDGESFADDYDADGGNSDASAGSSSDQVDGSGDDSSELPQPPWTPKVLDTPVPKFPRLYAPLPRSPTTIVGAAARSAAREALAQALQAADTHKGITFEGITGLGLEDKILLTRLLGVPVRGDFDEGARLDPASKEYWELLDKQLEVHSIVKHMFEPTWYKCRKLHPDLGEQLTSVEELEHKAQRHILDWLGMRERQLPPYGESASFDELVAVLHTVGATARLVTDPLPFLTTSHTPLDRNGMPLLIHMTFKDKGRFSRHHIMSLVSWARENPDHAILLYDDDDLLAYMSLFDTSTLQLYRSLKTAVERSDLWRYMVMCKHGGVYTDADTLCVRPIQEWNGGSDHDAEVLFGVEDVFKRDPAGGGNGWGVTSGRIGIQFEQWTLAGAPHHPVYCKMPEFIKQRVSDESSGLHPPSVDAENWLILHRTGPHVWTDSVLQWMNSTGVVGFHEALLPGGKLVDNNTRIMPAETFGCAAHFFSPTSNLEGVCAMHMFTGVWRKRFNAAAQAHMEQGAAQTI